MRDCPECNGYNTSVHPICYYCLVEFWYSNHKEFVNPRPRNVVWLPKRAQKLVTRLDNAVGNRTRPTIDKTDRVLPKRKYVPGIRMKKKS